MDVYADDSPSSEFDDTGNTTLKNQSLQDSSINNSSINSPNMSASAGYGTHIMHCDDLEKEMLKPTSPEGIHMISKSIRTQLPPFHMEVDKKTGFSIDAPEFVPQTVTAAHTIPRATPMHYMNKPLDMSNVARIGLRSSSPYQISPPGK